MIAVVGILLLMAEFLFLSEGFPLCLDLNCLIAPLFADNLGDFRIGEARVLRDDFGLMMLTVEDESFVMSVVVVIMRDSVCKLTVARSWDFRIGLADTNVCS